MIILSIETSCDETAVSIVEANGGLSEPHFSVLGNALFSQIATHAKYGGVFPMMAKREHAENLTPLLEKAIKESGLISNFQFPISNKISNSKKEEIKKILEREGDLAEKLLDFATKYSKPNVDVIAVTAGPGLEPALWVGISFAKALGALWDIPVAPVNHMEGHIFSILLDGKNEISNFKFLISNGNTDSNPKIINQIEFPAVALLISGGHTELVEILDWGKYKIMGQTKDDAVGEAFDKVARMLGLPYPGGPPISAMADIGRTRNMPKKAKLPRPMLHSGNLDFSFSGLKTAVLYYIRDHGDLSETDKQDLAREFEDAVVEVLVEKTKTAILETGAKTLIVAGGVISNKKLQESFKQLENENFGIKVRFPAVGSATDNALMIASACYMNLLINPGLISGNAEIKAEGNLRLS